MDRLDISQSNFLKRVNLGELPYQELCESEKNICKFLIKKKYIATKKHSKVDTSIPSVFQFSSEIDSIYITEAGKMYLLNENLSEEEHESLKELNNLKDISNVANENARFSKRMAIAAFIVSIVAVIVAIIGSIIIPLWN